MALNLEADIISGPTLGTGLSPFSWNSSYKESHVGLPKVYDFPFINTKPMPVPGKGWLKSEIFQGMEVTSVSEIIFQHLNKDLKIRYKLLLNYF